MSEELKPCPFCGSIDVANMYRADGTIFGIGCKSCHVSIIGDRGAWNTRHESSKPLTVDRLDNLYCKAYQETDSGLPLGPDPLRKLKCHTAGIAAIHSAMPSQDEKDRRIAELTTAYKAMREALEMIAIMKPTTKDGEINGFHSARYQANKVLTRY